MDTTKRIERSLQERISFLRNLDDESSIVKLADDHSLTMSAVKDALQLAKHPRNIHRFLKCCGLVEDVIEIYTDQGKEARRQLIYSLVETFIDIVTCEKATVSSKMELSRILNVVLEGCSLKIAQELLKNDNFIFKVECLFLEIISAGDFELQVMLIESLLRLMPQRGSRENFFHKLVADKQLLSTFLNIRDSHFDVDCRKFLNRFNEKNNSARNRVYSFPVENVKLDGEQIYKPTDEGYDDFWIDFNTGSKRISIFCQSTLLPSQLSQSKEPRWETLSLRASDCYKYTCDAKNKFWAVTVELKVDAQMLTNRDPEKQPHLFMCQLSQCFDVQTALDATMKLDIQKVSVPKDSFPPVHYTQKDPSLTHSDLDDGTQPYKQDPMSAPKPNSYSFSLSQESMSQKKCSIPLEPLNIITSSISSTDGTKFISWQALQSRIDAKKPKSQCENSETSSLKNSMKSSYLKSITESGSTCKGREEFDPNKISRGKHFVENLGGENASGKESTHNGKSPPVISSTDVYQSPVTASGDHACRVNKLGMPGATDKRVSKNLQKGTDAIVPECLLSLKDKRPSRAMAKALVEKSLSNTVEHGEKASTKQKKNGRTHSSSREASPSLRKSSLRSGKKALTPVVSFELIPSKPSQDCYVDKGTSVVTHKNPPNSSENSLINEKKVKNKNVKLPEGGKDSSNRQFSCEVSKDRLANDSLMLNENKTPSESFNNFKAPTTFNVSKNQKMSRKYKKEKQNLFEDPSQDPKNLVRKLTATNPSMDISTSSTLKSFHEKNLTDKENKKCSINSNQQTRQCTDPSHEDTHDPVGLNEMECDTVTESTSSFELCVENDKSTVKDKHGKIYQDFVCETQMDKTEGDAEDLENRDDQEVLTSWCPDKKLVKGHTHEATFEDLSSSKQFNLTNDTQISNAVERSYALKKNSDKSKNLYSTNKMDLSIEDRITCNKKNNIDDTENNVLESNKLLKSKSNAPLIKKDNNKIEKAKEIINKRGLKESCKSSSKSKSMENKNNVDLGMKASYEGKVKVPESSPTVTSSNDLLEKSHSDSGDNVSKLDQNLNSRKLRTRKKEICYAECDSVSGSSMKHNLDDTAISLKKSAKRNFQLDMDNITFLSEKFMDASPLSNDIDDEPCNYANRCPPMVNEGRPHGYRIWKSQEFKTTLTTIPITDSSDKNLIDPYNFESEVNSNHTSSTFKPTQKDKHRKSKKLTDSIHHFQQNVTTKVAFKDHIWKPQKVRNKGHDAEACSRECTPGKGKLPKTLLSHSNPLNDADGLRRPSFGIKGAKKNDTPNYGSGGIYFPHLDDPLPCTPYAGEKDNNDPDTIHGTQLSWIAKVKTSPTKRKKMRGKTYGKQMTHKEKAAPSHKNKSAYRGYDKRANGGSKDNGRNFDDRKELHSNKTMAKRKKNLHSTFHFDTSTQSMSPTVISGPSSTRRLNKSALKRKYPDVSSDSIQELSSDLPTEVNSPKVSKLMPKKLFDSDVALAGHPMKANKKKVPSLTHSMDISGDNCSFADINANSSISNRFNFEDQSKSKQLITGQKRKKMNCSPSHMKPTWTSKSPNISDEPTDDYFEQTASSPEIARESNKRNKRFQTTENRSNVELGFLSEIQPVDLSNASLIASSSHDSFEEDKSITNRTRNTKSHSFHESTDRLQIADRDAREMEYNDEEFDCYNGLANLLQLGNANRAARSQVSSVSDATQQILKSISHMMQSSEAERKGKRSKTILEFDRCLQSVIQQAERFSKEMKEAELKTTILLSQQIQRLRSYRESSEQCLESLKSACGNLMKEVKEVHTNQERVKKSVKSALKQDFDELTSGAKTKFNKHSLEAMRRCLQASFMM